MTATDHPPAEAGTDPRIDILAEAEQGRSLWASLDEGARESMRPHYRDLLARLDAVRSPVVPGDTATEGGDVRERAREVIDRDAPDRAQVGGKTVTAADAAAALAAAGLLATAGTEGEADEDDEAARLQELNGVLGTINAIGPEAPAGAVRGYVEARVTALGLAHSRSASPQGEAQGQGDTLPGPDYVEDGVEVWEAGQFTVRRDATSATSDPSVTLSGNLRPDVADPRALGLALLAAAPRAVAPAGNVDRETLDELMWQAFKDAQVIHDGADDHDDRFRAPTMFERRRMADVALAALRGERSGDDA